MKKKAIFHNCMFFMLMVLGKVASSQGMSIIGMCEFEKPNNIYK